MPADRGFALALSDLRQPRDTRRAVEERSAEVLEFVGDISDATLVTRLPAAVKERWGRADVLVNNAEISFISSAENVSAAEFRRALEINLLAPFLLAKAFDAMMLTQRSGSIVNVASRFRA